MSLKLPTQDSPVRDLFDIRDLAAFGHPDNRTKAGSFQDTLRQARAALVADPQMVAIHQFVFRAPTATCGWSRSPVARGPRSGTSGSNLKAPQGVFRVHSLAV